MNTSIVFDGEIDERSISRNVDKVDDELQNAGNIEIDADTSSLDIGGASSGERGGDPLGEMNDGISGMEGEIANRLPQSIPAASGIASAALPIALAGGVGAGLLKTMSAASGSLSATFSMFGTAMNLFFRPFGEFLSTRLRPMADDMIEFARDFNKLADSEGLGVAIKTMAPAVAREIGNQVKESAFNIASGEWSAKDLITIGASAWTASKIIGISKSVWGASSIMGITASTWGASSLLTIGAPLAVGAGSVIALHDTKDLSAENVLSMTGTFAITAGSALALTGVLSVPTATAIVLTGTLTVGVGELIDIARGGDGIDPVRESGQDFAEEHPGLAETIHGGFTHDFNPFYQAGQVIGSDSPIEESDPESGRAIGFARGGVITNRTSFEAGEAGPEVIAPFAEIRRMFEGMARREQSGGGNADISGDIQSLESTMNDVLREIRRLDLNAQITIGEREFARTVENAQQSTSGTDPLQ